MLETWDDHASGELEPLREDVRTRLPRALEDWPELSAETVTVARLDPKHDDTNVNAQAGMVNRIIYLPANTVTSWVTFYHELGHLAIQVRNENGADLPHTSEEFCSIFSMARMPKSLVDTDYVPYLGRPALRPQRWPYVCQKALDYRENHRDYIQQAKDWLRVGEENAEDRAETEPMPADDRDTLTGS